MDYELAVEITNMFLDHIRRPDVEVALVCLREGEQATGRSGANPFTALHGSPFGDFHGQNGLAGLGVGDGEVFARRTDPAGATKEFCAAGPTVLGVFDVLQEDVAGLGLGAPAVALEFVDRDTRVTAVLVLDGGVEHAVGDDARDARDLVLGHDLEWAVDDRDARLDDVNGVAVGVGQGEGGSDLGETTGKLRWVQLKLLTESGLWGTGSPWRACMHRVYYN